MGFVGPRFAKQVAGNPLIETQRLTNLKAAVEALPNGQNIWQGFNQYLEVMRAMGTRQGIGSKTAFNAEFLEASGGGSLTNAPKVASAPLKTLRDWWVRVQQGRNFRDIATMITDPEAQRLFARLVDMPTTGSEAARIAMRLSAIGWTSSQQGNKEKQPAQ